MNLGIITILYGVRIDDCCNYFNILFDIVSVLVYHSEYLNILNIVFFRKTTFLVHTGATEGKEADGTTMLFFITTLLVLTCEPG